MRNSARLLIIPLVVASFAAPVAAQQMSPADQEYMAAMDRMNQKMKSATDADPAKSFAKKMIVHHEGALEMSQAVLKNTKDAEIRRMTEKMMEEQKKDIKNLQAWVAKKGG